MADKIKGGKADYMEKSDFDIDQLKRGIEVEMEHTDDPEIAKEIAMDHLAEDPRYYSKLDLIHKEEEREEELERGEEYDKDSDLRRVMSYEEFINDKKMKYLKLFEDFLYEQDDGFGELDFFFSKEGDTHNYFFKLSSKEEQRGFVVSIGKHSRFSKPTEAKGEYGVIFVTELEQEELDQAILDKGKFEGNENKIEMDNNELVRFLDILIKIMSDYLKKNSKIFKFYDEIQDKLKNKEYFDKLKVALEDFEGGIWKTQEIEKERDILIQK